MSRKPEINGNNTFLGKRKKSRTKKSSSKTHLQNWIDSSSGDVYEQQQQPQHCNGMSPNYSPYWQPIIPNQRLYPAVSDPSVCNYPMGMPIRYRVEPTMSLPVYPMYQPWQAGSNTNINHQPRMKPKLATSTDSVYSSSKNNDSLHNQDFTSLPPVIDRLIVEDSDNKRRFSDPGIGPGIIVDSDGSSGRSSVLTVDNKENGLLYTLIEQVNALKESNRRLFRELHETKSELNALKQQASAWTRRDRDYEPGSLAEVIREVRDAAKVREDALITKVRHMIEEKNFNRSYFSPSLNSSREIDDLRIQLKDANLEKQRDKDRLSKLEEEIRNLKINSSRTELEDNPDANVTKNLANINLTSFENKKNPLWEFLSSFINSTTGDNIVQGTPAIEADREDDNIIDCSMTTKHTPISNETFDSCTPPLTSSSDKIVNSTMAETVSSLENNSEIQGTTQVLELEQETLQLRRDLQEAVDGRKEAEAKNVKYERQFQLHQRIRSNTSSPNETKLINTTPITSSSTNPFETNSFLEDCDNIKNEYKTSPQQKQHPVEHHHTTTGINFETTSPLHVTLSGPVTDL